MVMCSFLLCLRKGQQLQKETRNYQCTVGLVNIYQGHEFFPPLPEKRPTVTRGDKKLSVYCSAS
uniref:Uncharacterized protein n=1 Tax=Arundo donax TaxID=35708 RepID=A0A0A9DJI2_ARUDO